MTAPQAGKFNPLFAVKGYALNTLCHSLNREENRSTFLANEAEYCARFGLNHEEQEAVIARDKPRLFELGGNMYFLAKLDRVKRGQN